MEDELELELETGLDPAITFDEGMAVGTADAQEQLYEQLQDIGMPADQIEALFDPAPRRGHRRHSKKSGKHGKKCGTAKQVRAMPQIFDNVCGKGRLNDPAPKTMKRTSYHNSASDYKGVHHTWKPVVGHSRRTYDPAPKQPKHYRKKAKDMLSKLAKHEMAIGGVAAVGTFLALYNTRAGVLQAAGKKLADGTLVTGILSAIQYDYEQFTVNGGWTGASTRLQAAWKNVLGFGLGGILVNQVATEYVPAKYKKITRLVGSIMAGIGAGYAGKAILDLPNDQYPPAIKNLNPGVKIIHLDDQNQLTRTPQRNMNMNVNRQPMPW